MKVFVVPSWYPSVSNPIYGTFIKEQVALMARHNKDLTFGISLWGQGGDPFLLFARDPLKSLKKRLTKHEPFDEQRDGVHSFFNPAFTWSKRFLKGNLKGIIAANFKNLESFIATYGSPDVIHVQASYPGAWVARELSQKFDIPYIVTMRMSPFPFPAYLNKGKLVNPLFEVLSNSSLLIATSHSLKHRANSLGLKNVEVVHNPVDLALFSRNEKKSPNQNIRLLSVGRLEPQKGFDLLIRAMLRVNDKARLDIVGEGSEHENLQQQIDQLGLSSRIVLHGEKSRTKVKKFMQSADGYVLSSRHETFGNVLLEAMACGVPSVATRCGGPEDILTPEIGLMCESNNSDSLANAINQMLLNDWQSEKIRLEAEKRFSPEKFTDTMMNLYSQAIKGTN